MWTLRIALILLPYWLIGCCAYAQPGLSDLTAVEFEENQLGTVVASRNGTHHIVRLITRTQDATAPLLTEAEVRFSRDRTATARLVRRITVDDRYVMGLYRCTFTASFHTAPSINPRPPAQGQRLYVVMDERPATEVMAFQPRLAEILLSTLGYENPNPNYYDVKPDPATRGPAGAPVVDDKGSLIGITLESWTPREARMSVGLLPIARVRALILGTPGTGVGPNNIPCEQFDLREYSTRRNTCEQKEYDDQMEANRLKVEEARLEAAQQQHAAMDRRQKRWEVRKNMNPLAMALFVGTGGNSEFNLRPTGGIDLYIMPDRLFHLRLRAQGGVVDGERHYEAAEAWSLGFDRIRTHSYFGEGLFGFGLGKGDFYFSAMVGYGMETPPELNRSYGANNVITHATENWLRPVTQFDIGVQLAPIRLSVGFRTAHGAVPTVYKAQALGLPWMYAWPAEDLPANGTMIVLEFSYRLWGWWGKEMKEHASSEFYDSGGVDRPR